MGCVGLVTALWYDLSSPSLQLVYQSEGHERVSFEPGAQRDAGDPSRTFFSLVIVPMMSRLGKALLMQRRSPLDIYHTLYSTTPEISYSGTGAAPGQISMTTLSGKWGTPARFVHRSGHTAVQIFVLNNAGLRGLALLQGGRSLTLMQGRPSEHFGSYTRCP